MALRLLSKINRNLFHTYKNQTSTLAALKHTKATECNVNETLLTPPVEESPLQTRLSFNLRNSIDIPDSVKPTLTSLISPGIARSFHFSPMVSQARFYSGKNDSKCKKKSRCTKLKLCNCVPSKYKTCRITVIRPKCKKKLAPYPSFSEACYEEPYNKPSECKMCPWKPDKNPTFKGEVTVRKFHTGRSFLVPENNIVMKQDINVEKQSIPMPFLNIDNIKSPTEMLLKKKKKKRDKSKCKKFPFKKDTYEIGVPKKRSDCNVKPACKKKKQKKPVKDCPRQKTCIQREDTGLLLLDPLAGGLMMKKGKSGSTCGKKCPKKRPKKLVCPTGLIRKPGYKKKPKKRKGKGKGRKSHGGKHDRKCDGMNLPLGVVYNDGASCSGALRQEALPKFV